MRQVDTRRHLVVPVFDPDQQPSIHTTTRSQQPCHATPCECVTNQSRRHRSDHGDDTTTRSQPCQSASCHDVTRRPRPSQNKPSTQTDVDQLNKKLKRTRIRKWRSLDTEQMKTPESSGKDTDKCKSSKKSEPEKVSRTHRASSYVRFKYPVRYHRSTGSNQLTIDIPECLRQRNSPEYCLMPVRQGRHIQPAKPSSKTQSGRHTASHDVSQVAAGDSDGRPNDEPDTAIIAYELPESPRSDDDDDDDDDETSDSDEPDTAISVVVQNDDTSVTEHNDRHSGDKHYDKSDSDTASDTTSDSDDDVRRITTNSVYGKVMYHGDKHYDSNRHQKPNAADNYESDFED